MAQNNKPNNVGKAVELSSEAIELLVKTCPINVDLSKHLEKILERYLKRVSKN
jgi:hypothetical protein